MKTFNETITSYRYSVCLDSLFEQMKDLFLNLFLPRKSGSKFRQVKTCWSAIRLNYFSCKNGLDRNGFSFKTIGKIPFVWTPPFNMYQTEMDRIVRSWSQQLTAAVDLSPCNSSTNILPKKLWTNKIKGFCCYKTMKKWLNWIWINTVMYIVNFSFSKLVTNHDVWYFILVSKKQTMSYKMYWWIPSTYALLLFFLRKGSKFQLVDGYEVCHIKELHKKCIWYSFNLNCLYHV